MTVYKNVSFQHLQADFILEENTLKYVSFPPFAHRVYWTHGIQAKCLGPQKKKRGQNLCNPHKQNKGKLVELYCEKMLNTYKNPDNSI